MHAPAGPTATGPLRSPETSAYELLFAGCAALFAVWWLWPFRLALSTVDEGILLQGAVRILGGEIPYRDFFTFYTPGSSYIYAGIFRIFGTSFSSARDLLMVYSAVLSLITYLLARRAFSRAIALMAAVSLTLVCMPAYFAVLHNWDSTFTAMLALYFGVLFLEQRHPAFAFISGLLAGATLMIEQSKGAGLLLGSVLAGLLLFHDASSDRKRYFAWMLVGTSLPCIAVVTYFAAHHALSQMLTGWFWAFHHYSGANRVAYGQLPWAGFWQAIRGAGLLERCILILVVSVPLVISIFPIFLSLWTLFTLRRIGSSNAGIDPRTSLLLFTGCVVSGVLLATIATGHADSDHITMIAPLFLFMVPVFLNARSHDVRGAKIARSLTSVCLLLAILVAGVLFRSNPLRAQKIAITPRGPVRSAGIDELQLYLQNHLQPGSRVLMYPYDPLHQFLTATMSPTRFDFLQPGMHSPAEFMEARQELAADNTDVVVLDLRFWAEIEIIWPATPAAEIAKDPLGDFILSRYRACRVLRSRTGRPFAYMVRKDLACPQD